MKKQFLFVSIIDITFLLYSSFKEDGNTVKPMPKFAKIVVPDAELTKVFKFPYRSNPNIMSEVLPLV